MYKVYGCLRDDLEGKYRGVNVSWMDIVREGDKERFIPCFPERKLHFSLFDSWGAAERACYEMETDFPDYFFEVRV